MEINKYKNHWQQHQAHLWELNPPHHTHLGIRFFKFEYINIIQDYFLYYYRVGTCHSDPIYRVETWHSDPLIRVRTWHSDPILPCRNVTLRSIYLIILVHKVFFMPRRHLNRENLRLKIQQSHHSNPSQLHNHYIQTHNQA